MSEIHKKTWPEFFEQILKGNKTFDYRLADFEIKKGDTLILEEWDPKTKDYTGRKIQKKVGYVAHLDDLKFNTTEEEAKKYGFNIISLKD